jgi:hypothetical protein
MLENKISVSEESLNLRLENFHEKFRIYWKEGDKQKFVEITERELNSFYEMIVEGEEKLKKRVHKKSSLLCKSKGINKGKIWVYYKGDVQVEWGFFLQKYKPIEFYKLVTMFSNVIDDLNQIHDMENRRFEEKAHYSKLYFYSGLVSLAITITSFTMTIVFFFVVNEFVIYPFTVFAVTSVYSAIFYYFQQKNAAMFKEGLTEDFYTKLLPVLHTLPFDSKKVVEFFTVLMIVFVIMSVYFAKAIPEIINFYTKNSSMTP